MGHHRRWASRRFSLANIGFHYAYDGADRTLASRASIADAATVTVQTPPPAGHAVAGHADVGKPGPVANLGALIRNGLSRLLAIDF
jgi:hypothetical protein